MSIYKSLVAAHTTGCALAAMLTLSSCASPPQPPTVDDSTKRPVNTKAAVELQSCRGDLSRSTLMLDELARSGAMNAALAKNRAAAASDGSAQGNKVAIVEFASGSASWTVDPKDADAIAAKAASSAFIVIRGRTDAVGDSARETALARRRAEAAAGFLRARGVPADSVRVTWQGAGDPRPSAAQDRARNRRVEIEFYAAPPATIVVRSDGRANSL